MDTAEEVYMRLFTYLGNVLYHPEDAALKIEDLPDEAKRLASGLVFLGECIAEQRSYTRAIARGDLSVKPPSVDNILAAPLKELQGSLRHMTWQTEQVAKGDYSQRMDFLGEFSFSFNAMVQQLKTQRDGMVAQQSALEKANRELSKNLELVMALIYHTHSMIFVFSIKTAEPLFVNPPADYFMRELPECSGELIEKLMAQTSENSGAQSWEVELSHGESRFFRVESFVITWENEKALVHMVADDTERKNKENLIYSMAYIDPMTGLNNRRFAMDEMQRMIDAHVPFTISFIDVDYLKYCNDTFGHEAGDGYLTEVAHILRNVGGLLCRVGGDEFLLIQQGITAIEQQQRLMVLRSQVANAGGVSYPRSFSYACIDVPIHPPLPLEYYIKQADSAMYQYKMTHKLPLQDVLYRDDRN